MIAGSILLGRALAPVELAISVWRNFIAARFSYDRLKKTISDYPAPLKRTQLPSPKGTVVVDAISYLTPNTAQLILSQVSCAVEPGEASGNHRSFRRRQEHAMPLDGRACDP